jgi:prepilin-type N-terminal cleavage/methylation domain-containing protein
MMGNKIAHPTEQFPSAVIYSLTVQGNFGMVVILQGEIMYLGHKFFKRLNWNCEIITRTTQRSAFTLIELLVVIAVIAVLLGILIPVLATAKEKGRRLLCSSNVHQFILGTHVYANSNDSSLPSGINDFTDPDDEHTPVISTPTRNALIDCIGSADSLGCPWLCKPFTDPGGFYYGDDPDEPEGRYGYILGYNYLGGHNATPWLPSADQWISPQKTTDSPYMPLVTELNTWVSEKNWTFAPHGKKGPIFEAGDSTNQSQGGVHSKELGAAGGNIGLLDGSVSWKHMKDMKVRKSSRGQGCFSAW